jgi:trk system potassium uptake protein TrkH
MGVLAFMIAVMFSSDASAVNILRAESTGLDPGRMVPSVKKTAAYTWMIYTGMTVILVILLCVSGLPLYDSLIHAFSTAGTGGLSNMNASVAAYNNLSAEIIITVFMFLFGVNFTLYYFILTKKLKYVWQDEELRFYFGTVIVSMTLVAIDNIELYSASFWESLRYSSFQVSTIISSTGFSTADINTWGTLSHGILLLLMFTGCCAGSTGGGLKLVRVLVLFKAAKAEVYKSLHPNGITSVTLNGKKMSDDAVRKTAVFFFIYITIAVVSILLISAFDKSQFGLLENSSGVISMLSNIGPKFEGRPDFSEYNNFSKYVFSACMIVGRLEFFPVLILFIPTALQTKRVQPSK